MFTKRSLIVGLALVLAMIGTGLVAASAHTAVAPPAKQPKHPPYTLVRHIDLPDLSLKFSSDNKLVILGKLLPVLNNLPVINTVSDGSLLKDPMQDASSLLNGLFNLGAPNRGQ